ncbi:MAG: F0F1 ATP synthase subunit B [Chloroflexi bacterium]|nr:MAG: F0F1 ATP synthase subunit B [Chloroflexota bacterium]
MHAALFLDAGPLTINGTFIVEVIAFILMILFLAKVPLPFLGIPKPVYPWLISIAEARQRAITEQLDQAEKARADAEARLKEAESKLVDARKTAETVIEGANRSGEQLRQELRQKAEAEYQRIVQNAQKDIEAERDRALQSAQDEVAGMVVAATEKVIGETLDDPRHRKLIERAIQEVASGDGRR